MKTWTTEDGRTVDIKSMDPNHILNALKFLHRKAWNDVKKDVLAGLVGDVEIEELWEGYVHEKYRLLLAELRRREIEVPDYLELDM